MRATAQQSGAFRTISLVLLLILSYKGDQLGCCFGGGLSMERRRCRYFCVCLLALLGTVQVWADVTGSILGYVRDKSGAVLPNATITATQTSTGYVRTVKSDSSGAYSILALPPGRYRLTASVPSFHEGVIENVDLD